MALAAKIAQASKAVGGALSADKRNKDQNYDYISADKILTVCGQALAAQGVTVYPAIMELTTELVSYTSRRGEGSRYDARVQFLMKIADGDETQDLVWFGLGSDYSVPDKAVYKAITSGHKYFMMKLLNVGAGNEDGEHEQADADTVVKTQRSKPAKDQSGFEPEPGEDVWADWRSPQDAQAWAWSQGKFNAPAHMTNAYNKVKTDCAPKTARDMWRCWYDYVMAHEPASASETTVDSDEPLFN